MTAKQAFKLKKLILQRINAEIADSWKGGGDPDDWDAIERRLRDAKRKLKAYIEELTDVVDPVLDDAIRHSA